MRRGLLILMFTLALAGCDRKDAAPAPTVTIFAAASLTEAFEDLESAFRKAHPQVNITCNYAGTQQLMAQLRLGARADVLAAANTRYMEQAVDEHLVDEHADVVFALNRLVIVQSKRSEAHIENVADLAKPGVRLALADDKVPVGRYTAQMFKAAGESVEKQAQANVLSREQNVKAVLTKVRLGEADAGVVYATDVTPDAQRDVQVIAIPDPINVKVQYPIARLRGASKSADLYIRFILGDEGRSILAAHGFELPPVSP
ncbi:MAG: molybdate ABC transporter substrate-binding protein [Planctomycetes bacterium]|nr:molybdate ABC transporter substrate-binding protein [Planctomycetota bacterium]